jgi:hypothetical protein
VARVEHEERRVSQPPFWALESSNYDAREDRVLKLVLKVSLVLFVVSLEAIVVLSFAYAMRSAVR